MNKLNIPEEALKQHKETWLGRVNQKLDSAIKDGHFAGLSCKHKQEKELLKLIRNKSESLLIAKPVILSELKKEIEDKRQLSKKSKLYSEILPRIFNYTSFRDAGSNLTETGTHIQWGAFKYIQLLKVNCCPYCNRHYTFSLKVTRKIYK